MLTLVVLAGCGGPLHFAGQYAQPDLPPFQGEIVEKFKVSAMPMDEPVILDSVHTAWVGANGEVLVFDHRKNDQVKSYKGKEEISAFGVSDSLLLWTEAERRSNTVLFNLKTQDEIWRIKSSRSAVRPLVMDTTAIILGVDGIVEGYSIRDGDESWTTRLDDRIFANPAQTSDEAIVGTAAGHVVSINLDSGSVNWQVNIDKPIQNVAIHDSMILVGSQTGEMMAVDRETKKVSWWVNTGAQVRHRPLFDGDSLYWPNSLGEIYKISLANSGFRKLAAMKVPPAGRLVLAKSGLLFVGSDGNLCLLDPHSGEVLKTVKFNGRLRSAPIFIQNHWYLIAENHWMYEVR